MNRMCANTKWLSRHLILGDMMFMVIPGLLAVLGAIFLPIAVGAAIADPNLTGNWVALSIVMALALPSFYLVGYFFKNTFSTKTYGSDDVVSAFHKIQPGPSKEIGLGVLAEAIEVARTTTESFALTSYERTMFALVKASRLPVPPGLELHKADEFLKQMEKLA